MSTISIQQLEQLIAAMMVASTAKQATQELNKQLKHINTSVMLTQLIQSHPQTEVWRDKWNNLVNDIFLDSSNGSRVAP